MIEIQYDIIGKSIAGVTHSKSGKPNQDAILYRVDNINDNYAFGIVSDGHGSEKCFRSHLGSLFATEVLATIFSDCVGLVKQGLNQQTLKQYVIEELPRMIVGAWRLKVDEHLEIYPYSDHELAYLSINKIKTISTQYEKIKYTPYGATLLGALWLKSQIIYVQIGDGDILTTNDDGHVMRRLPEDGRLLGNETTSLCLDTAENDFRVEIDFIPEAPPHSILISTDGFINAYRDDTALFKFPQELQDLYQKKGFTYLKENLSDWLDDISARATGDDISMCMIISKGIDAQKTNEDVEPEKQIEMEVVNVNLEKKGKPNIFKKIKKGVKSFFAENIPTNQSNIIL